MRWVALSVVLLLLVACQQIPLQDGPSPGTPPVQQETGRPDINRVNAPQDMPDKPILIPKNPIPRRPIFVNSTPKTDLDVPLGRAIGDDHPYVTASEFPLLKHPPIRVSGNLLIGYEERLDFKFANSTGIVIFGEDRRSREIGTFLRFEQNKPILSYSVQLDSGTFEQIQGRDIQIMGHTYTIAEATNTSVTLYGKSVASNLYFIDNQSLTVNSSNQPHTVCKVTPHSISYELFTQGDDSGDIILSPDETLGENVGKSRFASDLFDMRYKGAPTAQMQQIEFFKSAAGYALNFGNVQTPLVEQQNGKLVLGRPGQILHTAQCTGYCIAPDDSVLLSDGYKTYYLRYGGGSGNPQLLNFYDASGKQDQYEFVGTPGVDARANIKIGDVTLRATVGPKNNDTNDYNISIEGLTNEIKDDDKTTVKIGKITGTTLPIDVTIPGERTLSHYPETLHLNITYNGSWNVVVGNVTFYQNDTSTDAFGQYSNILLQLTKANLPLNTGDDLTMLVSKTPLYGIVSLED